MLQSVALLFDLIDLSFKIGIGEIIMSDIMRPVAFSELLERAFKELRNQKSIFALNQEQFFKCEKDLSVDVFSQKAANPVGPAAGPHTQLAQNIITAYLAGSRFIELKTVQIMDTLEIEKPCIDMRDEGYNVEWSTEYTLKKAYDEYLKAYVFLHILDMAFTEKWNAPSFIFNMSVGYDLKGIKNERMQEYINAMMDSSENPLFREYIEIAKAELEDGLFEGTVLEGKEKDVLKNIDRISARISPSVTISTMHGCPPDEIERICSYMLEEKHLDVFVKLNPTLLGYERVRKILDDLGYTYVTLKRETFSHDLQYQDALAMLTRLVGLAEREKRGFGVKLTNTLGAVNDQGVLPGAEMYMSGRALFPISITLASVLEREFDGNLPISYSGGASALNIRRIIETGIAPVTIASDILKPGGYQKIAQIAQIAESCYRKKERIDVDALEALSKDARDPKWIFNKNVHGTDSVKVGTPLEMFDCYVAPCVSACPIHQMIPDYIQLAGEGRLSEALAVIYLDNALPNITGWICDHNCQNHCTRNDYEGPVRIRDVKKKLASIATEDYKKEIWEKSEKSDDYRAAVIGAGPAGLACAYFLARAGFITEVFEKGEKSGGVVSSTIPSFRIPQNVIDKDVSFIEENGVVINYKSTETVRSLKEKGYNYIFVAIGAEKSRESGIKGNGMMLSAIDFLKRMKEGENLALGDSVVVIGGGNTAMDASRMAKRISNSVRICYRRTEQEMPADREEIALAKEENVEFSFLLSPVSFIDGILTLDKMVLSEKDESGRRKPVRSGETVEIRASAVISAIGETADEDELSRLGYSADDESVFLIGDALTGPSSVVRAVKSARDAVESAISAVYEEIENSEDDECSSSHEGEDHECTCSGEHEGHECSCGCDHEEDDLDEEMSDEEIAELEKAENIYFSRLRKKKSQMRNSLEYKDMDFFKREAERCLECSYFCNKCVDVCPNRANVAIDMRSWQIFDDPFQIVHIDAYCNECGNCATFCPHSGAPYRDKFTIFSSYENMEKSTNNGFCQDENGILVRIDGVLHKGGFDKEGLVKIEGVDAAVEMLIDEIYTSYYYLLGPVED